MSAPAETLSLIGRRLSVATGLMTSSSSLIAQAVILYLTSLLKVSIGKLRYSSGGLAYISPHCQRTTNLWSSRCCSPRYADLHNRNGRWPHHSSTSTKNGLKVHPYGNVGTVNDPDVL